MLGTFIMSSSPQLIIGAFLVLFVPIFVIAQLIKFTLSQHIFWITNIPYFRISSDFLRIIIFGIISEILSIFPSLTINSTLFGN